MPFSSPVTSVFTVLPSLAVIVAGLPSKKISVIVVAASSVAIVRVWLKEVPVVSFAGDDFGCAVVSGSAGAGAAASAGGLDGAAAAAAAGAAAASS